MQRYTERVAVLIDKKTLKKIQSKSKRMNMPVSEWIRMVINKELSG